MNIHVFCEGPITLSMRILPLIEYLSEHGLKCKIITSRSLGILEKGKIGTISSIILTHPLREYLSTLNDPPDVAIIPKTSSPQMFLFERILRKRKTILLFDISAAIFLPNSKLFGTNIRSGSFCLEKYPRVNSN